MSLNRRPAHPTVDVNLEKFARGPSAGKAAACGNYRSYLAITNHDIHEGEAIYICLQIFSAAHGALGDVRVAKDE